MTLTAIEHMKYLKKAVKAKGKHENVLKLMYKGMHLNYSTAVDKFNMVCGSDESDMMAAAISKQKSGSSQTKSNEFKRNPYSHKWWEKMPHKTEEEQKATSMNEAGAKVFEEKKPAAKPDVLKNKLTFLRNFIKKNNDPKHLETESFYEDESTMNH